MMLLVVLSWLIVLTEVQCHVGLTFPPARKYDLDFLDNVRTKPPCGIPKGKLAFSSNYKVANPSIKGLTETPPFAIRERVVTSYCRNKT